MFRVISLAHTCMLLLPLTLYRKLGFWTSLTPLTKNIIGKYLKWGKILHVFFLTFVISRWFKEAINSLRPAWGTENQLQTSVHQGAVALEARMPAGAAVNIVALQFSLRRFCSLEKLESTLTSGNGSSPPGTWIERGLPSNNVLWKGWGLQEHIHHITSGWNRIWACRDSSLYVLKAE